MVVELAAFAAMARHPGTCASQQLSGSFQAMNFQRNSGVRGARMNGIQLAPTQV